jgi:hypothetical protein
MLEADTRHIYWDWSPLSPGARFSRGDPKRRWKGLCVHAVLTEHVQYGKAIMGGKLESVVQAGKGTQIWGIWELSNLSISYSIFLTLQVLLPSLLLNCFTQQVLIEFLQLCIHFTQKKCPFLFNFLIKKSIIQNVPPHSLCGVHYELFLVSFHSSRHFPRGRLLKVLNFLP